jgi:hypothetical protein
MHKLLLLAVLASCVLASEGLAQTWVVTAARRAPDGVGRSVILVNGRLSPSLTVTQGEELKVGVLL